MPVDWPPLGTRSNRVQRYVADRRYASAIGTTRQQLLSSHTTGNPPTPQPADGAEVLEALKAPKKNFGLNSLASKVPERTFDRTKAWRKMWPNILRGGSRGGVGGWRGTPPPPPPPPVVGVLGLCWMWRDVPFVRQRRPAVGVLEDVLVVAGGRLTVFAAHTPLSTGRPAPPPPPPPVVLRSWRRRSRFLV